MEKMVKHHYSAEQYAAASDSLCNPLIQQSTIGQVKLLEFYPNLFGRIRENSGYSNSDLLESFSNIENYTKIDEMTITSGGRSDAFIFTLRNGSLIIKTIGKKERKVFTNTLMEAYSKRILDAPESRLTRILGVYMLLPLKQNFLLMENIVPQRGKAVVYDLKGSTIDRHCHDLLSNALGLTLKDQDFRDNPVEININHLEKSEIYGVIAQDCELLRDLGIMDYSLLLGFYDLSMQNVNSRYCVRGLAGETYVLGIIDFFQLFDFRKATEKKFKSLIKGNSTEISAVHPNLYCKRLLTFLNFVLNLN